MNPCRCLFFILAFPAFLHANALPDAKPEEVGASTARLDRIDAIVMQSLDRGDAPGAVVLITHRGKVIFRRAYGLRSKQPTETPMTVDLVFDLASLTKPLATASSIMLLVEQGKLRPADTVAHHIPAFAAKGKDKITVEQLLLHTSGLIADNPVSDYEGGHEKAIQNICDLTPANPPGARFVYSDVNYILLGELVERLSGMSLDEFSKKNLFAPLGLTTMGFKPDAALKGRFAPTEKRDDHWLIGEVHDPRAALLGGVAGHAGLFATADDLAVYAQMLLNGGVYKDQRILSALTVKRLTTSHAIPLGDGDIGERTYGWDKRTPYSGNRGELFVPGTGFGHTGWTGTSLWIDPDSETAVILLTNRVHPDGKGDIRRLWNQLGTAVAASLEPSRPAAKPVLTGLDVMVRDLFTALKGRHIGLVTNHTGVDRDGRSVIDLLSKAEGVSLVALFSPEHGIRGAVDEKVDDSKDEKTGLPVYSLYGSRYKPTKEILKGVDTLVYDIQDAGCRFYTYETTLGSVMEAAADNKIPLIVLDRPNPLGGVEMEGPVLDAGRESFVGYHTLPVRHGLTMGELARLFNAERKIGCDLEVIPLENWRRGDFYDHTGLRWVNPSPNLRSLTETLLYPGVGLLETTNISVGRGTDRPFEWIGAPWLDGAMLAAALTNEDLPGVRFVPCRQSPASSTFKGKECDGVQILVDDWSRFRPVRTGLALACALHRLYPDGWKTDRYERLLGNAATLEGLKKGASWQNVEKGWQTELTRFRERRQPYLLYSE